MSIVSLYTVYDQVTQAIFSRILQFLKIHFAWVWASIFYMLSLMEVILFIFYILSMFVAYDFLHHPFTIYQVEPHAFSIPISIPNCFSIWRILHGVWFGVFFPFLECQLSGSIFVYIGSILSHSISSEVLFRSFSDLNKLSFLQYFLNGALRFCFYIVLIFVRLLSSLNIVCKRSKCLRCFQQNQQT